MNYTITVFLSLLFSVVSVSAQAQLHKPAIFRSLGFDDTYRIGDEWGKKPVTSQDLNSNMHYGRMAKATARVGGATGFFLGEFNGKLLMATNHHVCPSSWQCRSEVSFPVLRVNGRIVDFYGSWTDIDLAIFEISVSQQDRSKLLEVASPFAVRKGVYRGQPLATIGFGSGDNPRRVLMGNRDTDCVVFSNENENRFMGDPDELNPGDYKAWSFANGCDVSHGDSGSAMMDRLTGEVVGIIWTGRIPKNARVQSSAYVQSLLTTPNDDIWKELSYAVPATRIGEFLLELLKTNELSAAQKTTLAAMLQ